jgi:hypothetical protein
MAIMVGGECIVDDASGIQEHSANQAIQKWRIEIFE